MFTMPRSFRALPPDLFPFFSANWTPWGKKQPVNALLKAVREARVNLNGVFDFSVRPTNALFRDHVLADFQGSLLGAWHRLHADAWERDLIRLADGGRSLKIHSAWPDFLRALKNTGLRLDVRQITNDTLDQRPVWFDDAQDRPRLLQFWLNEGVDPGMTYSSLKWSVWLGIDALPAESVATLLAHGLSAQMPIFCMDGRTAQQPLGSLASSAATAMAERSDFWTSTDPRVSRWHDVATLLVQATPDLQQMVLDERTGEAMVREFLPTVWADLEQRVMLDQLDRFPAPTRSGSRRSRL